VQFHGYPDFYKYIIYSTVLFFSKVATSAQWRVFFYLHLVDLRSAYQMSFKPAGRLVPLDLCIGQGGFADASLWVDTSALTGEHLLAVYCGKTTSDGKQDPRAPVLLAH